MQAGDSVRCTLDAISAAARTFMMRKHHLPSVWKSPVDTAVTAHARWLWLRLHTLQELVSGRSVQLRTTDRTLNSPTFQHSNQLAARAVFQITEQV